MTVLDRLVRRWRRGWALQVGIAGGATTLLVAAAASRTFRGSPLALGLAAGIALGFVALLRRRRVDALVVARHLNRTVPALEESADLLVRAPEGLSPVLRMQRTRVERALGDLSPDPRLPTRGLRVTLGYAAAALLASLGLVTITAPGTPGSTRGHSTPAATRHPTGPPSITRVTVTIRPPQYTARSVRRTDGWDLDVEQDARVSWRVQTDRPVHIALLLTTDGDSIRGTPHSETEFEMSIAAAHSLLYQVLLRDSTATVASDYHRLTVIPDAGPTLTVVRPEPRTELAFGSHPVVPLEVLAADDYGLADAKVVATLTTGAGEAVRFREQVLEFDATIPRSGSRHAVVLRKALNLTALAMQPGDELYFYVLAHDRRTPEPNEARSETFFVSLTDTAHVVVADLSGLAVNALPEYLRSQRQIIIDTEELLARATSLAPQSVRDRSNNIGLDQHLLRERYGEIVGQEDVEAGTEPAIEHAHDTPESATLLAQSVKDTLQAAVAQMWEAELRLRTYEPRAALPYEYRALELLKQAQHAARAYVLRVGFEPPPLEPDRKRLTGTLTAIGNPTRSREVAAAASLAAVRAALDVVQRLRTGGRRQPGDAVTLEAAGRQIAQLAINEPGAHLETLRELRVLLNSFGGPPGPTCTDCLGRLEKGLWRALPVADPERRGREPASGIARDYFDRLRRPGSP